MQGHTALIGLFDVTRAWFVCRLTIGACFLYIRNGTLHFVSLVLFPGMRLRECTCGMGTRKLYVAGASAMHGTCIGNVTLEIRFIVRQSLFRSYNGSSALMGQGLGEKQQNVSRKEQDKFQSGQGSG